MFPRAVIKRPFGLAFIGSSMSSARALNLWEEASRHAVETAAIRDLRFAEVVKMDMEVEGGKVTALRTGVAQVRNV